MYFKQGFHLEKGLFKEQVSTLMFLMKKEFECETDSDFFDLFRSNNSLFLQHAQVCQRLNVLYKMASCDDMERVLDELGLLVPAINTRPLLSFSHPATSKNQSYWKVPAHQDWASTQGSLNGVTCWVPLVDVTEELGPMQVLPGSHLQGPLPVQDFFGVPICLDEFEEFQSIPMEAGDALFFSYFLVHKSGDNKSDRIRHSAHFRFDDIANANYKERGQPWNRIDKKMDHILTPGQPTELQVKSWFLNL